MNRLSAALFLLTLLVWARSAQATTVCLLQPLGPSPEVTEALNLLRGELLSVGLTATMQHRPADHDQVGPEARRWLEGLAAGGADAVVDSVEVQSGLAVDVWVVKANPLRFEVTRVVVDPDTPKASEVLALRAVEALRAGLLLADRAARRQQEQSPPKSSPLPVPARPPRRWGVEVGAVALTSLDRVGPALVPVVRASWVVHSSFLAQVTLAGVGTRPEVSMVGGAVRVAQHYGILGACYRLRDQRRLWPFVGLAAGALHTSVEGRPDRESEGRSEAQWSLLVDGGLGAGLQVSSRIYLTLAAHAQWATPYVAVHAADGAVGASVGRPNLGLTLTVGAWL